MKAEEFRIIGIWPADKNILWVHIEGPSKKWNHVPDLAEDKVFYLGLVGAYQINTQLDLLDKVLGNIVFPPELNKKLDLVEKIIEKYKQKFSVPSQIEVEDSKDIPLARFAGAKP